MSTIVLRVSVAQCGVLYQTGYIIIDYHGSRGICSSVRCFISDRIVYS